MVTNKLSPTKQVLPGWEGSMRPDDQLTIMHLVRIPDGPAWGQVEIEDQG